MSLSADAVVEECSQHLASFLSSHSQSGEELESLCEGLDKAIFLVPSALRLRILRGTLLLHQGDFKAACRNFRHALTIDPADGTARAHLASALYARAELLQRRQGQELDQAVDLLQEVVSLQPGRADYCMQLCRLLIHLGRHALAQEHLSAVIGTAASQVVPGRAAVVMDALEMRCRSNILLDNNEDAVADASEILSFPDAPRRLIRGLHALLQRKSSALSDQGTAQLLGTQFEACIRSFSQALVLSSWLQENSTRLEVGLAAGDSINSGQQTRLETPTILWQRARAYRLLELFDKSLEDIDEAMELVESELAKTMALADPNGEAGTMAGMSDQGIELWTALKGELSLTLNELALRCYAQENHAKAVACFTRCIELSPFQPCYIMSRGDALAAMGRLPEAVKDYERAYRLSHMVEAEPKSSTSTCRALAARLCMGYYELGRRLHNVAEFEAARDAFASAEQFRPRDFNLRYLRDTAQQARSQSAHEVRRDGGEVAAVAQRHRTSAERRRSALRTGRPALPVGPQKRTHLPAQSKKLQRAMGSSQSVPDVVTWFGSDAKTSESSHFPRITQRRNPKASTMKTDKHLTKSDVGQDGKRLLQPAAARERVRRLLMERWMSLKRREFDSHVYTRHRSKEVVRGLTPQVLSGWKRAVIRESTSDKGSGVCVAVGKSNRLVLPVPWTLQPRRERIVRTFVPVKQRAPFGPAYLSSEKVLVSNRKNSPLS